jgi:hypothetical protein
MDFSLMSTAVSSLSAAKELGKAMVGVRDFNTIAGTVAQMNEQLLKAQDALFAHNTSLNELQQKYFETTEKLRTMERIMAERGRYALFEITKGSFVYRSKPAEIIANDGNAVLAEPLHYVCQRCFDSGTKVVLQRKVFYGAVELCCSNCKIDLQTGETELAD